MPRAPRSTRMCAQTEFSGRRGSSPGGSRPGSAESCARSRSSIRIRRVLGNFATPGREGPRIPRSSTRVQKGDIARIDNCTAEPFGPMTDVDLRYVPLLHSPRSFTRWANRNCSVCFTSLAPLRRRAARGSSAHRTRPWPSAPGGPFPSGMVGRFPEAPISFSTRKAGLSDG